MKFITDKIDWTDSMKTFAEQTIDKKLSRLVNSADFEEVVSLSKLNKDKLKISVSLGAFRAQAVATDFYDAMNEVAATLKSIIAKHKKKYNNRARTLATKSIEEAEENKAFEMISKEKVFDLNPITLDEALMEFEKTDYPFYVYKDSAEENIITIIYKRFSDTYGLIRCH